MQVLIASEPATRLRPNEDFAAVAPDVAVLLDGAGLPQGVNTGCTHGVAWYSRSLGTALLAEILAGPPGTLRSALAGAITHVRTQHEVSCDLSNPNTPSATVAAIRRNTDGIDYLALSDSTIAAHTAHRKGDREPFVVTDSRPFADGYVAKADPAVADVALTGSLPIADLLGIALLSDGAARLADRFHLRSWRSVLALIRDCGPAELIRQVRAAEADDPERTRWPRAKTSDDATVIYWRLPD